MRVCVGGGGHKLLQVKLQEEWGLVTRLEIKCHLLEQLAEVFRAGPNFIKLCVLRVCDGSQRHLDKVIFSGMEGALGS